MDKDDRYKVRMEMDIKVTMRDGTRLSTDIYRPDAPGKFPVILLRTPYNNQAGDHRTQGEFLAKRGYVFVVQDSRGRHDSEGNQTWFHNERNDAYDTWTWCADQPWSNGKVGTTGESYMGFQQLIDADLPHPNLICMVPRQAVTDPYGGFTYRYGAFWLATLVFAVVQLEGRVGQIIYPERDDIPNILSHRPLETLSRAKLGRDSKMYNQWVAHPTYDGYWYPVNLFENVTRMDVPMYHWTSWYDHFTGPSIQFFNEMRKHAKTQRARENQKLVIGPWAHGVDYFLGGVFPRITGEIDFGPDAEINKNEWELRWFDFWLKGIDNSIMDEPSIKLFVMGENKWRFENEWPLARTEWTKYYLHSNSILSTESPESDEVKDTYIYDPYNPTPSLGGRTAMSLAVQGFVEHGGQGPRDISKVVEARDDVLTYTTDPLIKDTEVTGPVIVKLYASSTAQNTDWVATLTDVFPDGRSIILTEGILRTSYRDSNVTPSLIEPGRIYEYTLDLWATSNLFKAGHRIRLDISSANFPQFDVNGNTDDLYGRSVNMLKATQTIYHDGEHPSHVILPIIHH